MALIASRVSPDFQAKIDAGRPAGMPSDLYSYLYGRPTQQYAWAPDTVTGGIGRGDGKTADGRNVGLTGVTSAAAPGLLDVGIGPAANTARTAGVTPSAGLSQTTPPPDTTAVPVAPGMGAVDPSQLFGGVTGFADPSVATDTPGGLMQAAGKTMGSPGQVAEASKAMNNIRALQALGQGRSLRDFYR